VAFGAGTFNSLGAAVQDLFSADTHRTKAQGLRLEAENYVRASDFALQNARFTELSTGIKTMQQDRETYKALGGIAADVAGAGFASSGSALDIMRDSASQAALARGVTTTQGLITEEGYKVEAENYQNMGKAAQLAAQAEDKAADQAPILAGIHAAAAVASLFPPIPGGA
jgi:hypothetical protein